MRKFRQTSGKETTKLFVYECEELPGGGYNEVEIIYQVDVYWQLQRTKYGLEVEVDLDNFEYKEGYLYPQGGVRELLTEECGKAVFARNEDNFIKDMEDKALEYIEAYVLKPEYNEFELW